jgi:hypothetical protein
LEETIVVGEVDSVVVEDPLVEIVVDFQVDLAVDLVVDVEEAPSAIGMMDQEKCLTRYVTIAVKTAKFHLNQLKVNQFIVQIVLKKWVEEKDVMKEGLKGQDSIDQVEMIALQELIHKTKFNLIV